MKIGYKWLRFLMLRGVARGVKLVQSAPGDLIDWGDMPKGFEE